MTDLDAFHGQCQACEGKRDITEVESITRNGMRIWVCKSYLICKWREVDARKANAR